MANFLKRGSDYKGLSLVSLSGVYNKPKDTSQSKVPIALSSYLNKHKTKIVHLHLDNDVAGRNAATEITRLLADKYEVKSHFVPVGKHLNDYLLYTKNLPFKSHKERSDCR